MNSACDNLASLQSKLQQALLSTQSKIAVQEAWLANNDPGFPQWNMQAVIVRMSQLQPGPLADAYWQLFLLMCQESGYKSGGTALTAVQQAAGCLSNGS